MVLVDGPVGHLELGLAPLVLLQQQHRLRSEVERARHVVLDRPVDGLSARLDELPHEPHCPRLQVEIGPLEAAQLPLAGA